MIRIMVELAKSGQTVLMTGSIDGPSWKLGLLIESLLGQTIRRIELCLD